MMLRLADIESGADQEPRLVAGALADDFRTECIGSQQPVGAMLFGGADGDQDGLGFGQILSRVTHGFQAERDGCQTVPNTSRPVQFKVFYFPTN